MARILVVLVVLAALIAVAAAVLARGSQAAPAVEIQRTFVSTSGSDSNPCTRTAPCRGFQTALSNTLPGGEVVALDSGGYGQVTVNKAATIVGAPGEHVALSVFAGTGIVVAAGAGDTVVLRNLYLTGVGGTTGIEYLSGGTLLVEGVTAQRFTERGLDATATDGTLLVRNSTFRSNGGGLLVSGTVRVDLDGVRAERNSNNGLFFANGAVGAVRDSGAIRNGGSGFSFDHTGRFVVSESEAEANGLNGLVALGAGARVTVEDTVLTANNVGAATFFNTPLVRLSGTTITDNTTGIWNDAGAIETFGDNVVRGNTTNVAGALTAVAKT